MHEILTHLSWAIRVHNEEMSPEVPYSDVPDISVRPHMRVQLRVTHTPRVTQYEASVVVYLVPGLSTAVIPADVLQLARDYLPACTHSSTAGV